MARGPAGSDRASTAGLRRYQLPRMPSSHQPPRINVICLPELSLAGLLIARRSLIPGRAGRIRYGRLPRFLRAVKRFAPGTELKFLRLRARGLGVDLEKIGHEDHLPDYPALNLRAMTEVTSATLSLEQDLAGSAWTQLSGRLLGSEEALALAMQTVAHEWIWPQILQMTACAADLPS